MFKGRLFSSKKSDTSSPDGSSNSPRSMGSNSNSPIRSGSKKVKSASTSNDNSPITPSTSSISTLFGSKKEVKENLIKTSSSAKDSGKNKLGIASSLKSKTGVEKARVKNEEPAAVASMSPIVASSLGLNKIKTRSGPLPQESFFGYGSGKEKGSSLGASNLSKPLFVGGGDGKSSSGYGKKSSIGKKRGGEEKKKGVRNVENAAGLVDNGSNSDAMSTESVPSRDQSPRLQARSTLQNEESTSEAAQLSSSWGHHGGARSSELFTPPETKTSYDCDNPKESESPRFKAILRLTSAPRKRHPGDYKSFSHELNSKGVRPYPFWKSRGLNNLEEVLVTIRTKFDKAKEEVDSDLRVFAADLVGVLEKNSESHPEWLEPIEDLLVLARSCAMTTPGEFWLQCESIVQELDDRRQELPMGMLKKLHTRMLFILTRCTRLLQFHKESVFADDSRDFKLRQSLQQPADNRIPSKTSVDGKSYSASKVPKETASRKSYSQEQRCMDWKREHIVPPVNFQSQFVENEKNLDSPPTMDRMASWKKFPSPIVKIPKEDILMKEPNIGKFETLKISSNERDIIQDAEFTAAKSIDIPSAKDALVQSLVPPKHQHKVSWGNWVDQPILSDEGSIICRICEEEVPTLHVEEHSRICAISDRCDQKGLSVNERLIRISETLEKLVESLSQKDFQQGTGSYVTPKVSNSSITEEPDLISPKLSDWSRRGSEDMLDCLPEADNSTFMDDLKGFQSMSCRTRFGSKSDQGVATSSAGSMTPRSPLVTPRTSQIDLLLAGKGAYPEHDDVPQMTELADIARCVANAPLDDDRSLQYLLSCLEDLKVVVDNRKLDALTVDTFGARIEKLIREKYLQLCELVDCDKVDITNTVIDEDAPLEDDVVRSLRTSPIHPSKDRTSIDDFEILKPISRGAFGRVFLAQKRTTGDLFAIKVLRKADMIRKNAVESILAERDILISVRNPFVVRFFYSFTCRDNLYLVMEYLNGGDLYSLLRNLGCLDENVARVYIAEVVLALEYLHSLHIVHRDLKPDNLLIAHDGHIKLTDFGLSKVGLINSTDDLAGPAVSGTSIMEEDDYHQSKSEGIHKKRSAVGTPDYLAPEILLGTGHAFTADWWSVGVILFELIVGIPPFNAEHPEKIFDNILNRNIPWPNVPEEEMSREAQDLIDQLLTEDPNQRLGAQGASEVKQHPFFRHINWDTLARQKAAFVPCSDNALDTSYFTSRFSWNTSDEQVYANSEFDDDSSDRGSSSGNTDSPNNRHDELVEACAGLAEFDPNSSINYSFSNFSFKNLSQLASINYDLLSKGWKEDQTTTNPDPCGR